MSGLIIAVIAASLTAKDLVSARAAAFGCVSVLLVGNLILLSHPVPLLIACAVGFFPVWGSLVLVRRASFILLLPAILLVMAAGAAIDVIDNQLAIALNMHPRLVQEQIDAAERSMRAQPAK